MHVLVHSLSAVARFAAQGYTSDRVYEAGCQVAAALVGLLCILLIVQHWAPGERTPAALPDEPCLFISPPC